MRAIINNNIIHRIKSFFVKRDFKLTNLLTHPIFLSLVITIVLVFYLPPIFNKYNVDISNERWKKERQQFYYGDFDNDGISERIETGQLKQDNCYLMVEKGSRIIDQWNFPGKIMWTDKAILCKYKKGGPKVIYLFTFNDNKIYLNCLSPLNEKFIAKGKFVVDYRPKNKGIDGSIWPVCFYDSNKDGIKEFYFSITVGYSVQPRGVFKFDPADSSIIRSGKCFAALNHSFVLDTVNSRLNMVFASSAVGNSSPDEPYTDMYSWLIGFNENIKFLFSPIKIGYYPGGSFIARLNVKGQKYFAVYNDYGGAKNHPCTFYLFDSGFKLVKKKDFKITPQLAHATIYAPDRICDHFYLFKPYGEIDKIDYNLNTVEKIEIPILNGNNYFTADIDRDGKKEVIFIDRKPGKLVITSGDFSSYALADCDGLGRINNYSVKLNGNDPPELDLVSDKREFQLTYKFNYLYYFKYAIYGLILMLTYFFILLLQKAQKHRAELKYETEKRLLSSS